MCMSPKTVSNQKKISITGLAFVSISIKGLKHLRRKRRSNHEAKILWLGFIYFLRYCHRLISSLLFAPGYERVSVFFKTGNPIEESNLEHCFLPSHFVWWNFLAHRVVTV